MTVIAKAIISKILKENTAKIFTHKDVYEKKYQISRKEFFQVFNLYNSLSFLTVYK